MKALKLAEKRHSVREYKHKKLSETDRHYLDNLLTQKPAIAHDSNIEFMFIEEGYDVAPKLEGFAGYFGRMITAPHYYAVLCDSNENCYKRVGYVGEWFILNALKQDIGTCWIEVRNTEAVQTIINFEGQKEVVALIAIGYARKEYQQSNIYASSRSGSLSSLTDLGYPNINAFESKLPASSRKSITEFVYINQWDNIPTIEDLENIGLHKALFYMRLAPSYENRQPWYFLIKGQEIDLIVKKNDHISEIVQGIDAGIAMFYFEVGLHDSGFKGTWDCTNFIANYTIPEDHIIVGRYSYQL